MRLALEPVRRRGSRLLGRAYRALFRPVAARHLDRRLPPGARVHLGCGNSYQAGWINVDLSPAARPDLLHDLRLGFPAPAGRLSLVYSEHLLEHLSFDDGRQLLGDLAESLAPGGVVRFAMPDLAALVSAYAGDWSEQAWVADQAHLEIDTPAKMLNLSFREWGHRYLYDAMDLDLRLRQAGFTSVEPAQWGVSSCEALAGLETRKDSMLIMEASLD